MSQSNKPAGESKPQPAEQQKPTPTAPRERNLRTGWVAVGDSADSIRKGK